eukprot:3601346-Amphidinium_carterae.1
MPRGKRGRKRALAKMRQQQADKPTEDKPEAGQVENVPTDMDACAHNPELLTARLKKLEATQRLLGNAGPPAVLEELEQAVQTAKEQLRENAP